MSSCCKTHPDTIVPPCPRCGTPGLSVDSVTLSHVLKKEHRGAVDPAGIYFLCETPDCDLVYYGDALFAKDALRVAVTAKDDAPTTPLCYCFKITKGEALKALKETGTSDIAAVITRRMKAQGCFCEKTNPRGRCCLETVERWMATIERS